MRARDVPPGLGTYAAKEDRLDARLAAAVMGIQAVKGVEIGEGFALAGKRGSEAHDEIEVDRRRQTNHAGGIEAGISNGEEIVVRAAMKPLPTLMKPLRSVDLATGEAAEALVERSDVAAVEALAVVAEAAVAWELARAAHEKFGGDAIGDFVAAWRAYIGAHRVGPERARAPRRRSSGSWAPARRRSAASWRRGSGAQFLDLDAGDRGARRQDDPELFEERGEAGFREIEAHAVRVALAATRAGRDRARRRRGHDAREPRGARGAFTLLRDVDVDTAWVRVRHTDRPLARTRRSSGALYEERQPLYREVADAVVTDADERACSRPAASTTSAARSTCSASSCRATGRSRSSPTRT